ncbi:hypothetical protein, partial [Xanthomonas vasicola]|uniref:hypothetical protein n=1 Tax=Xanthomonas vasicola TaxID=56459 RepID=UPI001E4C9343
VSFVVPAARANILIVRSVAIFIRKRAPEGSQIQLTARNREHCGRLRIWIWIWIWIFLFSVISFISF